jgi:hypothetical protein
LQGFWHTILIGPNVGRVPGLVGYNLQPPVPILISKNQTKIGFNFWNQNWNWIIFKTRLAIGFPILFICETGIRTGIEIGIFGGQKKLKPRDKLELTARSNLVSQNQTKTEPDS